MKKYRIGAQPKQIDPALVEGFSKIETATIGHFRHRGFVHHSLRPVDPKIGTLVGTAVTVATPATDSTLIAHIVSLLRPGDVLMIDRLGDDRHACFGGGVAVAAKAAGAIAVVIDGPCTDPHEIIEIGLPVYCRGVTAITTRGENLGGSLNLPICCGNVPVLPGDVVLLDNCGIIVIPPNEAAEVLERGALIQSRAGRHTPAVLAGENLGVLSGASAKIEADQNGVA